MSDEMLPGQAGAWHLFHEPRAFYHDGVTFTGWATSGGNVTVFAYNHRTGEETKRILREGLDHSDHDLPCYEILPDGTLLVAYARNSPVYVRRSTNPYDISEWEDETELSGSVTYPEPIYLSGEDRVYIFGRDNGQTTMWTSDDKGESWSSAQVVIDNLTWQYSKVRAEGDDTIHMLVTRNPDHVDDNDLYYIRYSDGAWYHADGTQVATDNDLPLSESDLDVIWDSTDNDTRASDIRIDEDGIPYATHCVYEGDDREEHQYYWSYWDDDGEEWINKKILTTDPVSGTQGNMHFGGLCLKPDDVSTVYVSHKVDSEFEIEVATTDDDGESWDFKPITEDSSVEQTKPWPVENAHGDLEVHWLRGDWNSPFNFDTDVVSTSTRQKMDEPAPSLRIKTEDGWRYQSPRTDDRRGLPRLRIDDELKAIKDRPFRAES